MKQCLQKIIMFNWCIWMSLCSMHMNKKKKIQEKKEQEIISLDFSKASWYIPTLQEFCTAIIAESDILQKEFAILPKDLSEKVSQNILHCPSKFKLDKTISLTTSPNTRYAFSHDGKYFVYSYKGEYKALDIKTKKELWICGHDSYNLVKKVNFSLDGTNVCVVARNNNTQVVVLPEKDDDVIKRMVIDHGDYLRDGRGDYQQILKVLLHAQHQMLCYLCSLTQDKQAVYVCQNYQQNPLVWKKLDCGQKDTFNPLFVWYFNKMKVFFTRSKESNEQFIHMWNNTLECVRIFSYSSQYCLKSFVPYHNNYQEQFVFLFSDGETNTKLKGFKYILGQKKPIVEQIYNGECNGKNILTVTSNFSYIRRMNNVEGKESVQYVPIFHGIKPKVIHTLMDIEGDMSWQDGWYYLTQHGGMAFIVFLKLSRGLRKLCIFTPENQP